MHSSQKKRPELVPIQIGMSSSSFKSIYILGMWSYIKSLIPTQTSQLQTCPLKTSLMHILPRVKLEGRSLWKGPREVQWSYKLKRYHFRWAKIYSSQQYPYITHGFPIVGWVLSPFNSNQVRFLTIVSSHELRPQRIHSPKPPPLFGSECLANISKFLKISPPSLKG